MAWLPILVLFAALSANASARDAPRPPPLDQPAAALPDAAGAVLTGLAAAGQRLVAVGERGIVLLSDDGAKRWRQARSVPVSVTLTAVRFVTPSDGWVTGHDGVILHTADGGETWARVMDGVMAAAIIAHAAEAIPDGPAKMVAQRNAARLVADGPDKPFLDIDAGPGAVLAVGAYGLALRSDDGGAHFISAVDGFADPESLHIYHLARDGTTRIAVGEQGLLLVSRNGGVFSPAALKHRGTFFGVMATPSALVVYGLQGAVFRSTDHAESWSPAASATAASISCATTLQDGRIVIGTLEGNLLVSNDDGASFRPTPVTMGFPVSAVLQAAGAVVVTGARGVKRIEMSRLEGAG